MGQWEPQTQSLARVWRVSKLHACQHELATVCLLECQLVQENEHSMHDREGGQGSSALAMATNIRLAGHVPILKQIHTRALERVGLTAGQGLVMPCA